MATPKTITLTVFDDGNSAVDEFDRGETGQLTYVGRSYLEKEQTLQVLEGFRAVASITPLDKWFYESPHNQGSIAKVLELAASLITSGAPLDKDPYDLIVAREPFGELGRLLQSMGLLEPIEAPTED